MDVAGLLDDMKERVRTRGATPFVGGGMQGSFLRGLLGLDPAEESTQAQVRAYQTGQALSNSPTPLALAGITSASAVKLGKMSKDQFLGTPKIVSKKDAAALKPRALKGIESEAEIVPFMGGKYTARYTPDGAAVYDGDKVIASYNFGDTLVVDPKYRKQGIGEELVYQQRTFFPEPAKASTRNVVSQRIQENVWNRIQNDLSDPSKTVPSPTVSRSLLEQAPQAQALEIARQNAVKMLGLPESNTAMDRAAALGFTPAYHGTNDVIEVMDRSFAGAKTGNPTTGLGISVATNPGEASRYTKDFGAHGTPNVMPLMIRKGKVYDMPYNELNSFAMGLFNAPGKTPKERYLNAQKEAVARADQLRSEGYDTVRAFTGKLHEEVFVPDPARIRSRFAAFDPARINDKDLLASLAAFGVGLPVLGLLAEEE